jgi:hypothetical protein
MVFFFEFIVRRLQNLKNFFTIKLNSKYIVIQAHMFENNLSN